MTGVPAVDGVYPNVSDSEYHRDRGSLSSSGARLLLPPSCPAKFREAMDNPPPPKPVFDFGHLAHRLVLGEGADLVVVDAPDWRSKDARQAREDAHANGQTPCLSSEMGKAQLMADAVICHPVAGPLFEHGHAEMSLYATDPVTGIRLRARPDWMCTGYSADGRMVVVDYKTSTTANPEELVRKFYTFGYFMQAAWYLELVAALGICDEPTFLFVVQEVEPPYLVTVIDYDEPAIEEGRRRNHRAIDLYADCVKHDRWPGYAEGPVTISLPPWAYTTYWPADHTTVYDLIELEGTTT